MIRNGCRGGSAVFWTSHWERLGRKEAKNTSVHEGSWLPQTNRPVFICVQGEKILSAAQGGCHHQWCCFLARRILSCSTSGWSQSRSGCSVLVLLNVFQLCPLWEERDSWLWRGSLQRKRMWYRTGCRSSRPLITHLFSSHGKLLDPLDLNSDPYNRSVDV